MDVSIFKQNLIHSLPKSSDLERKKWASDFISFGYKMDDLKSLLFAEPPVPTRFSWLISDICEIDSKSISLVLKEFFERRESVLIPNFERSLAKWFFLAGVPKSIEGNVYDALSRWFLNPKMNVSTKRYCLLAMFEMAKKHADLKMELKELVQDQLDKNTPSFKKFATKILTKL